MSDSWAWYGAKQAAKLAWNSPSIFYKTVKTAIEVDRALEMTGQQLRSVANYGADTYFSIGEGVEKAVRYGSETSKKLVKYGLESGSKFVRQASEQLIELPSTISALGNEYANYLDREVLSEEIKIAERADLKKANNLRKAYESISKQAAKIGEKKTAEIGPMKQFEREMELIQVERSQKELLEKKALKPWIEKNYMKKDVNALKQQQSTRRAAQQIERLNALKPIEVELTEPLLKKEAQQISEIAARKIGFEIEENIAKKSASILGKRVFSTAAAVVGEAAGAALQVGLDYWDAIQAEEEYQRNLDLIKQNAEQVSKFRKVLKTDPINPQEQRIIESENKKSLDEYYKAVDKWNNINFWTYYSPITWPFLPNFPTYPEMKYAPGQWRDPYITVLKPEGLLGKKEERVFYANPITTKYDIGDGAWTYYNPNIFALPSAIATQKVPEMPGITTGSTYLSFYEKNPEHAFTKQAQMERIKEINQWINPKHPEEYKQVYDAFLKNLAEEKYKDMYNKGWHEWYDNNGDFFKTPPTPAEQETFKKQSLIDSEKELNSNGYITPIDLKTLSKEHAFVIEDEYWKKMRSEFLERYMRRQQSNWFNGFTPDVKPPDIVPVVPDVPKPPEPEKPDEPEKPVEPDEPPAPPPKPIEPPIPPTPPSDPEKPTPKPAPEKPSERFYVPENQDLTDDMMDKIQEKLLYRGIQELGNDDGVWFANYYFKFLTELYNEDKRIPDFAIRIINGYDEVNRVIETGMAWEGREQFINDTNEYLASRKKDKADVENTPDKNPEMQPDYNKGENHDEL